MYKKLFLLILFFILVTPAQAVSWPPEVKPEKGRASGTIEFFGAKFNATIDFWNVGEVGGGEYSAAIVNTTCLEKITADGWTCVDDDDLGQGIFSGGPNGKITLDGEKNQLNAHLVDGKYFEVTLGETFQLPLENPEIFSKYRWSMDESVPIPEIGEGKYEVETYGSARFNDLYGQVEVNFPNPDGTYDDEAWNFAKIDMEMPAGTRIKVSEKSGVLLTFPDTQTNITVGPDTEIVLVSPDPQKSIISLPWGKLKANVQKMMKDGSMEIEMSQAVAGIKGTQFSLNDTKTESSISVTEGTVTFTSKSTGASVDVGKGESVTATSKGLSEKTAFDPVEEEKQWQELGYGAKKKDTGILDNRNMMYILGGSIITAIAIGFLLLKVRKHKK